MKTSIKSIKNTLEIFKPYKETKRKKEQTFLSPKWEVRRQNENKWMVSTTEELTKAQNNLQWNTQIMQIPVLPHYISLVYVLFCCYFLFLLFLLNIPTLSPCLFIAMFIWASIRQPHPLLGSHQDSTVHGHNHSHRVRGYKARETNFKAFFKCMYKHFPFFSFLLFSHFPFCIFHQREKCINLINLKNDSFLCCFRCSQHKYAHTHIHLEKMSIVLSEWLGLGVWGFRNDDDDDEAHYEVLFVNGREVIKQKVQQNGIILFVNE